MATLQQLTETVRSKAAASPPFGHKVMFDLGPDGVIFWDGTQQPPQIDNDREDAEAILTLTAELMDELFTGKTSGTAAFMSGKIKLQGSMSVAMKLGTVMAP